MKPYLARLPDVFIAFVFIQSLFFKFSGAEESIYIFQTIEGWIGLAFFEPGMRYGIGVMELIASVLLFIPGYRPYGAILALGIMSGAIFFHLFSPLGVVVKGDDGVLFIMAVLVWLSSAYIIFKSRNLIFKIAI